MLEHFLVRSRENFASLQKSSGAPPRVPERQSYQYTLARFPSFSVTNGALIRALVVTDRRSSYAVTA